jgi:EVE domain
VARNYWLDLFTGTTWEEFLAAGGEVSGFRERRWKTVQQMKPGDYLLCYLTGISRWIGVLEVVSEPFKDTTPIWKDEAFPARVRVRPVATLSPETAVPVSSCGTSSPCSGTSRTPTPGPVTSAAPRPAGNRPTARPWWPPSWTPRTTRSAGRWMRPSWPGAPGRSRPPSGR